MAQNKILILDFGSQYTQLIARRIRECNVYCEIHPFNMTPEAIRDFDPAGMILSGGPKSVYEPGAPLPDPAVLEMKVPVLGICYGLQLISLHYRGSVARAARREYGRAKLHIDDHRDLFKGINKDLQVWMSHGDRVEALPQDFEIIAHTANAPVAAIRHHEKSIFAIQFHPEVVHTEQGSRILENFAVAICGCKRDWTPANFIESEIEKIREQVGEGR